MRNRIISFFKYFFFLGAGLFLVWWQLKSMTIAEKEQFYAALKNAHYWVIFPIAALNILSHISRSMRWKIMMEGLDYNPTLRNVFLSTMIGYLANSAVPRLGELIKCTLLSKYEKLKVDKLVGTIIVERSFDILCYFVFIGITILIQINTISEYFKKELNVLTKNNHLGFFTKSAIIIVCVFLVWKLSKFLIEKFQTNKVIIKISLFLKGIIEGFNSIKKLKKKRAFFIHTLFIWTMYLGQIYLGFQGMAGTNTLGLLPAFSVLTFTTLSMIITPGGIGAFPIFVMQTLVIYGIEPEMGKAFGWLMWGVSTGIVVLIGFLSLLAIPYINRFKK